jgi:hypothetical protein
MLPPPTLHFFLDIITPFLFPTHSPPPPTHCSSPPLTSQPSHDTPPPTSPPPPVTRTLFSPQVTPGGAAACALPRSPRCRTQARTSRNDAAERCCRAQMVPHRDMFSCLPMHATNGKLLSEVTHRHTGPKLGRPPVPRACRHLRPAAQRYLSASRSA